MLSARIGCGPEESKLGIDQLLALRMVDYVQRLVCAVGPTPEAKPPMIDDVNYEKLREHIASIFRDLHPTFFVARSAALSQRPDYNRELDEFGVLVEMHWAMISGDRYAAQDPPHYRDLLTPHDEIMQRVIGVSAEQFAQGIVGIQRALTFGFDRLFHEMKAFQEDVTSALAAGVDPVSERGQEQVHAIVKERGWTERRDRIAGQLGGVDLFDVALATSWPDGFIKALSLLPGGDPSFAAGSRKPGWPTRQSMTALKPFVRWGNRSYVFDQAGCMDHLYRAVHAAIVDREPSYRETWNRRQKIVTEWLPFHLFERILRRCDVYQRVKYQFKSPDGAEGIAECDGLVFFDGNLIVVEVKAGAYTSKSPTAHIEAHLDSLKDLIVAPIKQGRRFLQELRTHGHVELLDEKLQPLLGVSEAGISEVSICCVTLDQLTNHAPQIEHLRILGISPGEEPVWPVSLDDLRVMADVFTNPLVFLHFLRERKRAFGSSAVRFGDELDHLGAYLKHTHYVEYAAGIQKGFGTNEPIAGWTGYRDLIDQYYHKVLIGQLPVNPPRPNVPAQLWDILEVLAQEDRPGRSSVASALLDLEPNAQAQLVQLIEKALAQQALLRRPFPISVRGKGRVTLCIGDANISYDKDEARLHTLAVMQLQREKDRILLLLRYEQGRVQAADFAFLTLLDVDRVDSSQLDACRFRIAQARMAHHND